MGTQLVKLYIRKFPLSFNFDIACHCCIVIVYLPLFLSVNEIT